MEIQRVSMITGTKHTKDIKVTAEQLDRWHAGEHIQDVMSHLSADEREFLMSGITSSEWDKYVK